MFKNKFEQTYIQTYLYVRTYIHAAAAMFKKKVEFKGSAVVGGKDMKKLKKDVAESTGIRCAHHTGRRGHRRAHATPPAPARRAMRLDTAAGR
jgi:hypothetical protein